MTRKHVKFSRKSKHKKEDKSKIVDDYQQTRTKIKTKEEPHLLDLPKCVKKKEKSAKQVHIAFLPEKYEPLVEDEVSDKPQNNTRIKQDKYKKMRKNVGKALRYSWKCLVAGLQSFSAAYSTPLSAVVPEIHKRSYTY